MPIETTLLALPVTDLAIVGAMAAVCCMLGWKMRRLATRSREAALQRSLFEAKGAVPQLETAVRNREQQANTLTLEIKGLKNRLSELEASARQKDSEITKRDREIRTLNSELTIVKEGTSSGQVLLDGDDTPTVPATADPAMAKRHAALEARYEALKRGMIQRDDRIAELEDELANPGGDASTRSLEHELCELEQSSNVLKGTLEEREKQLEVLQTRLQEEVAQREALEDLAKRRSEGNRELKSAAAKYEQQIPSLMETIKTRTDQIAERDGKLLSLTRALKDERQQREARETEGKDLQDQLAAMKSQQRDLQQRLHEQDQARAAQEAELANTRDALRATESIALEREAAIAEANERIDAGERTLATLQRALKDRDFKIEGLEAAARQQSVKLDLLRATFFEAKASHNEHIADFTTRHDRQRQALDELTAELETLRGEMESTRESLARAEAQHRIEIELRAEVESRLSTADARNRTLENAVSAQELALEDRELELEDLRSTRAELTLSRQTADALTGRVVDLTESLARSAAALRQRQCAILLLLARLGPPPLLLPAPAAEEGSATGGDAVDPGLYAAPVPAPIAATVNGANVWH